MLESGEGYENLLECCSCNFEMVDLSFGLQIAHNLENLGKGHQRTDLVSHLPKILRRRRVPLIQKIIHSQQMQLNRLRYLQVLRLVHIDSHGHLITTSVCLSKIIRRAVADDASIDHDGNLIT